MSATPRARSGGNVPRRLARTLGAFGALLLVAACESEPRVGSAAPETAATGSAAETAGAADAVPATLAPPPPDTVPIAESGLIDPDIPPAVAGEDGWHYQQSAAADLDGDGEAERVVLTARVELLRGRPVWDDGQPWQVYVEERDGSRTYLFAQRLQLGTLTMRVALGENGAAPSVVLIEHLPDRIRLFEAFYRGPSDARVDAVFERRLDPTGDLASPSLP